MKKLLGGMLVGAALLMASPKAPQTDAEIAGRITREIRMYPRYTIWDDIQFRVAGGQVELLGAVNQPYKKKDLERLVQRVPGVVSVTNQLNVLPLSNFDDRIRLQVARAIYGDPVFTRYAINPLPSIHIIVEHGRVTLTGVVANESEKNIAGIRASSAGLSFGPVVNNLRVERPAVKKG
jgi:hyperosmotically inducible protein